MKYVFLIIALFFFYSCKNESDKKESLPTTTESVTEVNTLELGKKLFNGKGTCLACHKPDQKIIGPSIVEIAQIYKDKNADMVEFLKGNSQPIVDPSQFEVMKANFQITKKMSDQELEALVEYMYSFLSDTKQ
jgi:cytochrome c